MEEFLAWIVVVIPALIWCRHWMLWPERNLGVFESMGVRKPHAWKVIWGIVVIFVWSFVWGFDWRCGVLC